MNIKQLITLLITMSIFTLHAQVKPGNNIEFNDQWKFFLGDDSLATTGDYNDAAWRRLTLPHDWSIEGTFSEKNPATTQGGALPGGIGWYRKTFNVPASATSKQLYILFDGIYRNSEVWINGHYLGKRPNGYISFQYELTPFINFGNKKNVIAVKVDNSQQPNSRWYSGSGIYRNVYLITKNNISIDPWETFITTPVINNSAAVVNIKTAIKNKTGISDEILLQTSIYDASGKLIASGKNDYKQCRIAPNNTVAQYAVSLKNPHRWSVQDPYLYKAVIQLIVKGKEVDQYSTNIGIRSFNFDVNKGFTLNDVPMKIKGVCMHHDLGALGAAVNTRAIERQLQLLRQMGCNAIRTAHNPPAPELLDLCDKMGFLVMVEAFDMWKKKKNKFDYYSDFEKWHKVDLEDMVKRDRNHPSVFMWSIGNEIREQFDSTGISITQELVHIVKELDTTRPVTAALSESDPKKNFMYKAGALDVVGLNYHHEVYADFQKNYPGQKFLGTENMSALASRGHYDMPSDSSYFWPAKSPQKYVENGNADYTVSAYDQVAAYWGSTHETTWKIIKKHDFLSGLFVWTGFDYLGEPTPYPWPARSSYFGIVDLAGFPKDVYYMYQSEWTNKPVLHLFPPWNWQAGKKIDVWCYYNNADEVELYLNGRSLGIQQKKDDQLHVMWQVVFEPGTLKVVSRKNKKTVLVKEIKTAGAPYQVELVPDRKTIGSDGKDLSFVTIRVLDKYGNIVPNAKNLISVKVNGNASLVAMDNGYPADTNSFHKGQYNSFNGLCLAVIKAGTKASSINITASSPGLIPHNILLRSVR